MPRRSGDWRPARSTGKINNRGAVAENRKQGFVEHRCDDDHCVSSGRRCLSYPRTDVPSPGQHQQETQRRGQKPQNLQTGSCLLSGETTTSDVAAFSVLCVRFLFYFVTHSSCLTALSKT